MLDWVDEDIRGNGFQQKQVVNINKCKRIWDVQVKICLRDGLNFYPYNNYPAFIPVAV